MKARAILISAVLLLPDISSTCRTRFGVTEIWGQVLQYDMSMQDLTL